MAGKDPSKYDIDEVCLFVTAIGLGNKVDAFRENAVDGSMLVGLTSEDFGDLGLSGLQGKKVIKSIGFVQSLSGGSGEDAEAAKMNAQAAEQANMRVQQLEKENLQLQDEIAALRMQLQDLQPQRAPAYTSPPPVAAPAPKPAPRPQHHVVRGAAGGAARGALLGTVAGAIAGDAGKGAKMGAAVGATGGALNGLGARRRARLRGRR